MTETDHVVGHLVCVTQDGEGKGKIPLLKNPLFIGRNADCQIRLKDVNVCERHCVLQISQRKTVILHRLNSDFPVLVNGKEISCDGYPLRNNDVIQISDCHFRWYKNENEEKLSKRAAHLSFCSENESEFKLRANRKSAPECLYSRNTNENDAEEETSSSNDVCQENLQKDAGNADSCEDGNSDEEIFNRTFDYDSDSNQVSAHVDQNVPSETATVEANFGSSASKVHKNGGISIIGETTDGNSNSSSASIDLIISEDDVPTSVQTSEDVPNSCLKTPERSEECGVPFDCETTPPSELRSSNRASARESTALKKDATLPDDYSDIELNILENTHVTPPKECQLNESRVQSTPQSSATPLKHLTVSTPNVAESPGKFRGRRSTGIVPCVGTPSDVYRIKRSILVTPAIRTSRDTVRKEAETSSASRQPRRRSSERKSTPLKPRFSDKCIQRESILYSPIIEDAVSERCEESQNESLSRDSGGKFKFVQSRRRRFAGSNFAIENRILEESETSQNTTAGTIGNMEEDIGDEDKSLLALSLCDDSSAPMSARIIINGDRAESVSDVEELNSTFTIDSADVPEENSPVKESQPLKSILTPLPKIPFSHREKSVKKVTFACNIIAESSGQDSVDNCSLPLADSYNSSAPRSSYNSTGTPEVSSNLYSKIEDGLDSFCQHEEVFTSRRSLSSAFSQNSTSTPVKQSSNSTSLNSPKLKNVTRSLSNWDQSFEISETRRVSPSHRSSAFSVADTFAEDNVDLTALQEAEKEQNGGFSLIEMGDGSTNSTKELSDEFVTLSNSKLVDSLSDIRDSQKSHSRVSSSASACTADLSSKTLDGVADLLTTVREHDETADITANTSHLRQVICNTGVTPQLNQLKLNEVVGSTPSTPCAKSNDSVKGDPCYSTPNNSAINEPSDAGSKVEERVPSFVGTPYPNLDRTANRNRSFLSSISKNISSDDAVKFATPKRPSRAAKKSGEGATTVEFATPKLPSRASARGSEGATPTRKSTRISLKVNNRKDTPASTRSSRMKLSNAKVTDSTPRTKLSILEETPNDTTCVESPLVKTPSSAVPENGDILFDGENTAGIKIVVTESTILECDESDSDSEPIEEAVTQDLFETEVDQEAETQDVLEMENAETQLIVPFAAADEVGVHDSEPIEEALTQIVAEKEAVQMNPQPLESRDESTPLSPNVEDVETRKMIEFLPRVEEKDEERNTSARSSQAWKKASTHDIRPPSPKIEEAETQNIIPLSPDIEDVETQGISPSSPKIEEVETQGISPSSPEIEEAETQSICPSSPGIEEAETQAISPSSPEIEDAETQHVSPLSPEIEEAQTQDIILFSQGIEDVQTQDIAVLAQVLEETKTQDAFALLHDGSGFDASDDNALPLPDTDELVPLNIGECETQDKAEEISVRKSTTREEAPPHAAETMEETDAGVVQNETPDVVEEAALPDIGGTSPNRQIAESAEAPDSVDEKIEEAETQDLLCERIEEAETQAVCEEPVSLPSIAENEMKELLHEVACADVNLSSAETATPEPVVTAEAVPSEVEPSISVEANVVSPAAGHGAEVNEVESSVEQTGENLVNFEVAEQSESPQEDREEPDLVATPSRVGVLHSQTGLVRRSARISLARGSPFCAAGERPTRISLEKSASKRTKKDRDNQENELCFDAFHRECSFCCASLAVSSAKSASTRRRNDDMTPAQKRRRTMDRRIEGNTPLTKPSLLVSKLKHVMVDAGTQTSRRNSMILNSTPSPRSNRRALVKLDNTERLLSPYKVSIPIRLSNSSPESLTPFSVELPAAPAAEAVLDAPTQSSPDGPAHEDVSTKPKRASKKCDTTLTSRKASSPKAAAAAGKRTRQQKVSTFSDESAGSTEAASRTSQRTKTTATTRRTTKKVENVPSSPQSTSSHAGSPKGGARKRRNPYAELATVITPPKRAARGRAAITVPIEENGAPPAAVKSKRGVRGSREKLNECVAEPTKTEIEPNVAPADKKRAIRSKKNASLVEGSATSPEKKRVTRGTRQQVAREVIEKASPANKKGVTRTRQANVDQTESEPVQRMTRKKAAATLQAEAEPEKPTTSKKGAPRNRPQPEQEVSPKSPVAEVEEKCLTRKKAAATPQVEPEKPSTSQKGATEKLPQPEQEISPKSPVGEVEEKRLTRKKAAATPQAEPGKLSTSQKGATRNRQQPEQEVSPKSPVAEAEEKRLTRKRAKKEPEQEKPAAEPEPEAKPSRTRSRAKNAPPSEELVAVKKPKRGRPAATSLVKDEKAESSRGPRLTVTRKSLTMKTVKRRTRADSELCVDDEPQQKRAKVPDSDEEITKPDAKKGRPVKVIVGKKVTTTMTSTATKKSAKSSAKKAAAKDDEIEVKSPPLTMRTSMMTRGAKTRASMSVSTSRTTRSKR